MVVEGPQAFRYPSTVLTVELLRAHALEQLRRLWHMRAHAMGPTVPLVRTSRIASIKGTLELCYSGGRVARMVAPPRLVGQVKVKGGLLKKLLLTVLTDVRQHIPTLSHMTMHSVLLLLRHAAVRTHIVPRLILYIGHSFLCCHGILDSIVEGYTIL